MPDAARHTFLSMAIALNLQSKATWAERAGHDETTFNTYLQHPLIAAGRQGLLQA